MHIVTENKSADVINDIWQAYRAGKLTNRELQTRQAEAQVAAGDVCERCKARPVAVIVAGKRLCAICGRLALQRRGVQS